MPDSTAAPGGLTAGGHDKSATRRSYSGGTTCNEHRRLRFSGVLHQSGEARAFCSGSVAAPSAGLGLNQPCFAGAVEAAMTGRFYGAK